MVDYVVVGAGAAGCVLADRLSEDPTVRVVLLEAGGGSGRLHVRLPAAFNKLFKTDCDWAYETEPEEELGGRRLYWPRGKMLGGSTAMNAMIYIRGARRDYDGWAADGNDGWAWKDVLPFFKKSERRDGGETTLHGGAGPMHVSKLRLVNPVSEAFLRACAEAGYVRREDFNGEEQEGFGAYDVYQRHGRRFSAADAYLTPALGRPNLRVETHAHATRVLFEGGRAVGVEYVQNARTHQIRVDREVLLAGGAVNSPQLLLLSGVGPADALRSLGIDVVADLPGVGENLQDHPCPPLAWACLSKVTLDSAETLANLGRFLLLGRGPLTSNIAEVGGFMRTRHAGVDPDLQVVFAPAWFQNHGFTRRPGSGFSVGPVLLRPKSRGTITLKSRDPFVAPAIAARYFSAPEDFGPMVEGVKMLRAIVQEKALAAFRGAEVLPGDDVRTDEQIRGFLRAQVETLYHPVGTCTMGRGARAVVDPHLRVHGVERLRVIDASIMPTIIGGNTEAPTVMIAERAAGFLRERAPS